MTTFRYALFDYGSPRGMQRGYFGTIHGYPERRVVEPGECMPVCVRIGAVPRLMAAQWSSAGTTAHARRRSGRPGHGLTPQMFARSRTYGPLYHRRQRCLVPASGYYRTRSSGSDGSAVYVRSRDRGLVAFAGLWEQRITPEGTIQLAFAIVTRMSDSGIETDEPLILAPEQYDAWLDDEDPRHLLTQHAAHLVTVEAPRPDIVGLSGVPAHTVAGSPAARGMNP
ncbi:MAG: SOS response-associated peptidase family protein [Rhodospirillaceae bacterium]